VPWPAGVPAGTPLVLQWWFVKTTLPHDSASNALTAVTP
jgi:hypothetical protein